MLNNILLIDDNPDMLSLAREEWRKYGGCITEVPSLKEAIGELNNKSYHLIAIIEDHVKDELLPIIKQMVDATDAPIIVLTSEFNRITKIASINIGADEYMSIPDSLEEIVVSGYALVRRYRSIASNHIDQQILEYAGIVMYLQERRVKAGDKEIQLSRGEFNCLIWVCT